MNKPTFTADQITVNPKSIHFYVPPITWKGDPIGHIGGNDTFFWLVEGELFLCVDTEYYLLKAGQLAFLPQGKFRKYTCLSKDFTLYTTGFHASAGERNLMEGLGLSNENYVAKAPEAIVNQECQHPTHYSHIRSRTQGAKSLKGCPLSSRY